MLKSASMIWMVCIYNIIYNNIYNIYKLIIYLSSSDLCLGFIIYTAIIIGFTQTVYEANENQDSVMVVCAEVEEANGGCLADFTFKVGFRTAGGSAGERSLFDSCEERLDGTCFTQMNMRTTFL